MSNTQGVVASKHRIRTQRSGSSETMREEQKRWERMLLSENTNLHNRLEGGYCQICHLALTYPLTYAVGVQCAYQTMVAENRNLRYLSAIGQ